MRVVGERNARSTSFPAVVAGLFLLATSAGAGCTSILGDFTPGGEAPIDGGLEATAPQDSGLDARPSIDAGDAGDSSSVVDTGLPDFSITTSARSRIVRGQTGSIAITIARAAGFSGAIAITATAGAGVTFDPLTIAAGTSTGTLTLHAAATTKLGLQTVPISAKSGALSHDASTTLVVQDASGSLDTTFGAGGRVVLPLGTVSNDLASRGLAIVGDGLLVCGNAHGPQTAQIAQIALARLTKDGALEPTFGTAGSVLTNSPGSNVDVCGAVSVLPSGQIAVGGFMLTSAANAAHAMLAARFTATGQPDTTFSSTGFAVTPFGTSDAKANSMIPQADGKLVLGGFGNNAIAYLRESTDGTLDKSYGSTATGTEVITFPNAGVAASLAIQSNGQIVSAISFSTFLVFRQTTAGILDTAFGSGGHVVLDVGGQGSSSSGYVVVQPDDAIVVAGQASVGGGTTAMAVARFTSAGAVDPSFGTGGSTTLSFAGGSAIAHAAAIAEDGAIVLAGESIANGGSVFTVARVTPTGKADTSFSPDGRITFDVGGSAQTVTIDAIGRILIAGKINDGSRKSFVVYRLWP